MAQTQHKTGSACTTVHKSGRPSGCGPWESPNRDAAGTTYGPVWALQARSRTPNPTSWLDHRHANIDDVRVRVRYQPLGGSGGHPSRSAMHRVERGRGAAGRCGAVRRDWTAPYSTKVHPTNPASLPYNVRWYMDMSWMYVVRVVGTREYERPRTRPYRTEDTLSQTLPWSCAGHPPPSYDGPTYRTSSRPGDSESPRAGAGSSRANEKSSRCGCRRGTGGHHALPSLSLH